MSCSNEHSLSSNVRLLCSCRRIQKTFKIERRILYPKPIGTKGENLGVGFLHELFIQPLRTTNCFDPNLYNLYKNHFHISTSYINIKNPSTYQNNKQKSIQQSVLHSQLNQTTNVTTQELTQKFNLVKPSKHFLPNDSFLRTLIQSSVLQILNTQKPSSEILKSIVQNQAMGNVNL